MGSALGSGQTDGLSLCISLALSLSLVSSRLVLIFTTQVSVRVTSPDTSQSWPGYQTSQERMKYQELSVSGVLGVLLQVSLMVLADPQEMSDCVRSMKNSSLVVISPTVLSSLLDGAGSDCQHCFTLLDDDQPILQGCWTPGDGCNQDCLLSKLITKEIE